MMARRVRRATWLAKARADQLPPDGDWHAWYCCGGRGSGKTRAGAEALAYWILNSPPGDWAVVAPTYADARDTCVEGPDSGLLAVLGVDVANWNRSLGELRIRNGSRILIDGGDDGALRIQGKNLRGAWLDEAGLFKRWDQTWNESLAFAVRLDPARIVVTGTPKGRRGIPKLLIEDPRVPVTRLRMVDNAANLSPRMVESLTERYAGTVLGRQELDGEMLDDVAGALWSWKMIEDGRRSEHPPLKRIVVGVDPAVTKTEDSSETGIVVAGVCRENHAYILSDLSGRFSPDGWASRVVNAYHEHKLDRIIAERNNGGDMVEATIRTVDPSVPIRLVWASRGKRTRAEPVAALYEQGRVHHVGAFPDLESQMTGWVPDIGVSPDRVDATVWAVTDLLLGAASPTSLAPVSVTGQASW